MCHWRACHADNFACLDYFYNYVIQHIYPLLSHVDEHISNTDDAYYNWESFDYAVDCHGMCSCVMRGDCASSPQDCEHARYIATTMPALIY